MMNKKSVIKEESYRNFQNLSHELKTPVANLNLVLETLYEYDKTISIDKKKEILQLGLSEIKRLQDLIYYFSKINSQVISKGNNNKQLQNINLIDRTVFVYDNLSFEKNIFIKSYEYNNKIFGLVNIDSKTYNNVIFNLIGNASKFINYHGWIILEVDIVTSISLISFNYINLSRSAVADNGVGMTANTQFLVKSTQSFSSGSTQRLGLSIVKEILSTYCLVLNVISYPSRGAKLYFDIKVFPNNK